MRQVVWLSDAMPWKPYGQMTDDELAALVSYLLTLAARLNPLIIHELGATRSAHPQTRALLAHL